MAKRVVKVKAGENLTDDNIKKVISLLQDAKPITKKAACLQLRINYNTTRLNTIIETYKDRMEFTKIQRAKKRGTKAEGMELSGIIFDFLKGDSYTDIAKRNYRTVGFVKKVIDTYNIPSRASGSSYFYPELIPDNIIKEEYDIDEICWSAQYNSLAIVTKLYKEGVYSVWVYGAYARYASVPWYELGSLKHLEELGINLNQLLVELNDT